VKALPVIEWFEIFGSLENSFRLCSRVDLTSFGVVVQAALTNGVSLDPLSFDPDGLDTPEGDIGRVRLSRLW